MNLRIREKPREWLGAEFTAEMVLGTEPLAEGIIRSARDPVIISETYDDGKGQIKRRTPRERILEHWYFVRIADGEKRKIFIGDFILKDVTTGEFSVLRREALGNFEISHGPFSHPVVLPVKLLQPSPDTTTTASSPQDAPPKYKHWRTLKKEREQAALASATA